MSVQALSALLGTRQPLAQIQPYLLAVLAQHSVGERAAKAAIRLTGRARPGPSFPSLEPATAALRASEPYYRGAFLLNAAKRLQTGLDTDGVGYTGALQREGRYYGQHRRAIDARDRVGRELDGLARRHGPVMEWRAIMDDRTDPVCRRMHGRRFDVRDPPAVGYPGTLEGGNCRCRAVAPAEVRAVAAANLAGVT